MADYVVKSAGGVDQAGDPATIFAHGLHQCLQRQVGLKSMSENLKTLISDFRTVYMSADKNAALDALDGFPELWDRRYPRSSVSQRNS